MSAAVQSIVETGTSGLLVDVECHISNGLPGIIIVGFANKAVGEARERIRSGFSNAKLQLPPKRITLNLAPADVPKDSTSFDLPIAAAILKASGQVTKDLPPKTAFIGEIRLDGSVRAVRGILGKLLAGRRHGLTTFFVPFDNLNQSLLVPGITVIPLRNLRELYLHLSGQVALPSIDTKKGRMNLDIPVSPTEYDFQDIIGQAQAKRVLEIAAAGGHNVLLNGPPGTGKSMLAKALPSILPPLTHEEMMEVTHLHSLASKTYDHIVTTRPFRSPHHHASDIAIIGGGSRPLPGEVSLSHRGVLFLDELPEFQRNTIEALRQPLEDKVITVARAKDALTFPANFMLIATANPCPCGFYGTSKTCSCRPSQIANYQHKLSGPILDRIDMYVHVDSIDNSELLKNGHSEESSLVINRRVLLARHLQTRRYGSAERTNSNLTNADLKTFGKLTAKSLALINQAANRLQMSARSYLKVVKVARTIADLAASEQVELPHISEALQYRSGLPKNEL